ncbi:MAG: hypothetical protein IJP23_06235 [Oscillospiraceae bacterium]|nr:hypothetical protein [Oscillospiraceae bacterium]
MNERRREGAEKVNKNPIVRRVLLIIILAGVLAYIGVYIYQALHDPVGTSQAIAYTATDSVEVSGWVFREETPLTVEDEFFSVSVSDGTRVSKNGAVAVAYNSQGAWELGRELMELEAQLEQLEYSLEYESAATTAAALDETVYGGIMAIAAMADEENLSAAGDTATEIKSALLRRDYVSQGIEGIEEKIEQTTARITVLKQQLSATATSIASPYSGTYSSYTDGLERVLTPFRVKDMSAAQLESAVQQDQTQPGTVGKIVSGSRWYYAYTAEREEMEVLRNKKYINLAFKDSQHEPYEMLIEQMTPADASGRCVVLLSSSDSFAEVIETRQADAELIFSSYTGLRIPKQALHIDEDGNTGVYCISGVQTYFKEIEIIWIMDEYYVIRNDTSSATAVKDGEEVVIYAKDLYEGKIVR